MSETEKTFKDRLIEELSYQGLSNKEFAHMLGINIGTLGMYLYRGSIPAADVAVRMAQALNTTTEYLVTGTDSTTPPSKSGTKSEWQKKEINHILSTLSSHQLTHFLEIARAYKNGVCEEE